jgi:methionyl aminopeptidase
MTIENNDDLQGLLAVGQIVGQTLQYMRDQLQPGMTTQELDDLALAFLARHQARSAPQVAVGFPGATCISINDEAAHAVPSSRRILAGDIVKLDVSAELNGYFADAAITVAVPPLTTAQQRLCVGAEAALHAALTAARAGATLRHVGQAAERTARRHGFQIVRALHGHGVGRWLHEAPRNIPSFDDPSATYRLTEGLVVAIEPHVSAGSGQVIDHPNGWTISTRDRSRVAAFEHTVIITNSQPLIVTAA